jgi:23S rRNA (cytosine1962-C5)-methyltransferase
LSTFATNLQKLMFQLIHPEGWTDYELIDSGNFEKLERFGEFILIRPEPQALWPAHFSKDEWQRKAHAWYRRDRSEKTFTNKEGRGQWEMLGKMPESWNICYELQGKIVKFKLALTSFGHIGVFPEQADNWQFIYKAVTAMDKPKVLNLFAYTGGASMAAAAGGADVTHLDSVKQTISWTNENRQLSNLPDIRWVVEDAMKFVQREQKRRNVYEGIILDPPAYGRGPKGEKWLLDQHLNKMIFLVKSILNPKKGFLVMNLYSLGMSALAVENIMKYHFPGHELAYGENYIPSAGGQKLPLGIYIRFNS